MRLSPLKTGIVLLILGIACLGLGTFGGWLLFGQQPTQPTCHADSTATPKDAIQTVGKGFGGSYNQITDADSNNKPIRVIPLNGNPFFTQGSHLIVDFEIHVDQNFQSRLTLCVAQVTVSWGKLSPEPDAQWKAAIVYLRAINTKTARLHVVIPLDGFKDLNPGLTKSVVRTVPHGTFATVSFDVSAIDNQRFTLYKPAPQGEYHFFRQATNS